MSLAAVFVAPLALLGFALIQSRDAPEALDLRPEPVTQVLQSGAAESSRNVSVTLTWRDGATLVAPDWSGLVTEVSDQGDGLLRDREVVLAIDGISRIAARTEAPFFRSLSSESRGEDVRQLNGLLDRWGMRHSDSDRWTASTALGVRELAGELGLELPANAAAVTFEPAWLIWLSADEFALSRLEVSVGSQAPSVGETVASGTPVLESSRIDDIAGLPSAEQAGNYQFRVGEEVVGFSGQATNPFTESDALARAYPGQPEQLSLPLERIVEDGTWPVPPSSVFSGDDGSTCVAVRQSDRGSFDVRNVEVSGGDVGRTQVAGSLQDGESLLVNPVDILSDLSCVSG